MALTPITGGGSFTRTNIDAINSNFAAITNPDLWVRPQAGNNTTANGTYERPFATVTGALTSSFLKAGMSVGLLGVTLEECSTPRINDITLVGMGNFPRQATSGGIANGGGATWLSPTSGTGALLQPNGQGWRIANIFFNCSATAAPAIKLVNAGDPPTANCSESITIEDCTITATDDAIGAVDLPNWVTIRRNKIFGCSGAGDYGISSATGLGTGTTLGWIIEDNDFLGNANHITAGLSGATIRNNQFSYIWNGTTSTTQVVLTGGANNNIYNNRFAVPFNVNGLSAMFATGTNDRWGPNSLGTACLTPMTGFVWGIPVSGAA